LRNQGRAVTSVYLLLTVTFARRFAATGLHARTDAGERSLGAGSMHGPWRRHDAVAVGSKHAAA
jgi:hypothetical protein